MAEWTIQQMREAFTFNEAPKSPWQNPFAERIIGPIRRDCLDHVIVFSQNHLLNILKEYFAYYHNDRPHQ